MNRTFIRNNINLIAIAIFLIVYGITIYYKPFFLYNKDGSLREFGLGTKRRTIIPAWFLAIILAILSYFVVLYYLAMPKMALF
jgi:hypothetical protein